MVRSIGADRVVDYTQQDFPQDGQRYDLIIDCIGNRSLSDLRRVLARKGTLIFVGGSLRRSLGALVISRFVGQRMLFFIAKIGNADLIVLKELMEADKVTPVIDRTYPLGETPEAIRYLEAGHAQGKVVITV